jgi:hypothetical protein
MHPERSRASERRDLDLSAAVVAHEAREANALLPPPSARSQIEHDAPTPAALTGVKKHFRSRAPQGIERHDPMTSPRLGLTRCQ